MTSINQLSKTTDEIFERLDNAERALRRTRGSCNGWGIMAEPSHVRSNVGEALAELRKAYELLNATKWPTDAEYEALEIKHNRG